MFLSKEPETDPKPEPKVKATNNFRTVKRVIEKYEKEIHDFCKNKNDDDPFKLDNLDFITNVLKVKKQLANLDDEKGKYMSDNDIIAADIDRLKKIIDAYNVYNNLIVNYQSASVGIKCDNIYNIKSILSSKNKLIEENNDEINNLDKKIKILREIITPPVIPCPIIMLPTIKSQLTTIPLDDDIDGTLLEDEYVQV